MEAPLLEKIFASLRDRDGASTASEIAHEFLRLTGGPSADPLVRRLLARDARFAEVSPGVWEARAASKRPIGSAPLRLAWLESSIAGGGDGSSWRLHSAVWSEGVLGPIATLAPDEPHPWRELLGPAGDLRWASLRVAPVARAFHWIDRQWGIEGPEEPPLDLGAWARVMLAREGVLAAEAPAALEPSRLAAHWNLGPVSPDSPGGALAHAAAVLEHLLERCDEWDDADLQSAIANTLGGRAAPWERFAFDASWVAGLPETPGVYRFRNRDGALLYVGKARSLRARLASYFRPLPPEPSRRAELLDELHRIDLSPTDSELAALVGESEAIRTEAPRWNVQVQVRGPRRTLAASYWPLLFVAPGLSVESRATSPTSPSVFLLEGPEDGFSFRLPGDDDPESKALALWLGRRGASTPRDAGSVEWSPRRLDPAEARLVLRYFLAHEDAIDRVDCLAAVTGGAVLRALQGRADAPEPTPRA